MPSSLLESLFDESENRPLSVTEINSTVRADLERRYASVWIEGEITNFNAHQSGHWYFSLRDEKSQIKAACFRGANNKIKFKPMNGLQVRVRGKLTVYEPNGSYQIVVESLEPSGEGALRAMFEQIEAKLRGEGLFEAELKRKIPFLPKRVGVITSASGAAFHDVVRELYRHSSTISVLLIPALVQGEGAGADLKKALELANEYSRRAPPEKKIDVLIIGRGGGSMEDLWAFNEEALARAIRSSEIPVISAVGHDIDYTISDYIADVRAATPTAAAQMVAGREERVRNIVEQSVGRMISSVSYLTLSVRHRLEILSGSAGLADFPAVMTERRAQVEGCVEDMVAALRDMTSEARSRVDAARSAMSPARLRADLNDKKGRFAVVRERAANSMVKVLRAKSETLAVRGAALDALSPLKVLNRGYSIALDGEGGVIASVDAVNVGDDVKVRLADGHFSAKVSGREGI